MLIYVRWAALALGGRGSNVGVFLVAVPFIQRGFSVYLGAVFWGTNENHFLGGTTDRQCMTQTNHDRVETVVTVYYGAHNN